MAKCCQVAFRSRLNQAQGCLQILPFKARVENLRTRGLFRKLRATLSLEQSTETQQRAMEGVWFRLMRNRHRILAALSRLDGIVSRPSFRLDLGKYRTLWMATDLG